MSWNAYIATLIYKMRGVTMAWSPCYHRAKPGCTFMLLSDLLGRGPNSPRSFGLNDGSISASSRTPAVDDTTSTDVDERVFTGDVLPNDQDEKRLDTGGNDVVDFDCPTTTLLVDSDVPPSGGDPAGLGWVEYALELPVLPELAVAVLSVRGTLRRDVCWEMKLPIFVPHVFRAAFVSLAACEADCKLRGFNVRPWDCVCVCVAEDNEKLDRIDEDLWLRLFEALALTRSISEREISTGVLEDVDNGASPGPNELTDFCDHRPRTPSTALKKLVDPDAKVRERASRVGASCSWICRSWRPSDNRNPISTTTFALPEQGCLHDINKAETLRIRNELLA